MCVGESDRRLKVAIIGGGPGGLSAAIELSNLSFVEYNLYEKKSEISETGGGISLQPHTWRLLEHNGSACEFTNSDYFRAANEEIEQRRNGRTGLLIHTAYNRKIVPPCQRTCRLSRAKLQAGLLKRVDKSRIHVKKKLVKVDHLQDNRIRIAFDDGESDIVDLLIAADGIRSSIRQSSVPDYNLRYNGQCVYRTIVSQAEVRKIKTIPWSAVFWKHRSGLYVYTCPLGGDDFEVTVRIRRKKSRPGEVSWGRPFDLRLLLSQFEDFCEPVRQILNLAASGNTQEFALLSGPRLRDMTFNGNIAFVGDAAHALCGNFGAGAGFALEDVYSLAQCLAWSQTRRRCLKDALYLYDSIRSPHYQRLFEILSKFAKIKANLAAEDLPIDKEIEQRIKRLVCASESWMYDYEIDKVVGDAIRDADACINSNSLQEQQA